MKICLLALTALLSANIASAESPFKDVKGKSLIWGVDDCQSTNMLDKAIAVTGLNVLDDASLVSWSCSRNQELPYTGATCPYPQYMVDDSVTCHGHAIGQVPFVCFGSPRTVVTERRYAGYKDLVKENRARFSSVYIISKSAGGFMEHQFRYLDEKGCNKRASEEVEYKGRKIIIKKDGSDNSSKIGNSL